MCYLAFIAFIIFLIITWRSLHKQPKQESALKPLRTGLNYNEDVFNTLFSTNHLARTYPVSAAAKNVRVNGNVGMGDNFDPTTWKLHIIKKAGDTLFLTMDDIKALPKTELVFDFKCIEGWSQVTHWGGVVFSEFAKKYGLINQTALKYAGLVTPDKQYYVGIDMPSMMHPQTCFVMK